VLVDHGFRVGKKVIKNTPGDSSTHFAQAPHEIKKFIAHHKTGLQQPRSTLGNHIM
jgi:hypothetical protein